MTVRVSGLLLCLFMMVVPKELPAQQGRVHSILFLDQSDSRGPFYQSVFIAFRERMAEARSHISLYPESFNIGRFSGAAYEQSLRRHIREKYRDRPIDLIVAIGPLTLGLVMRWHDDLWPGIPVVFGLVDEDDLARMKLLPDVTGGTVRIRLSDEVKVARAAVRDLDTVVLVGDAWERQAVFGHWKEEINTVATKLHVTSLIGLPIAELQRRVSALSDKSAIIYTAIYSDGEGGSYPPDVMLGAVAKNANRPIIAAVETYLEPGALGGAMLQPRMVGEDVASRALRIIGGQSVSDTPVTLANAVKLMFNWRQMQRWHMSAAQLPSGSEIRFYEPGLWEQYRWQSILAVVIVLFEASLISILLQERKRRSYAELEARQRLSELAHVHRQAIAGELSSSIAHELNQPLGSILTNSETAELILNSPQPDLNELKEIVADIRHDDLRASQIITHMRGLLKKTPFAPKDIDLSDVVRNAFNLMSAEAEARNVALQFTPAPRSLRVMADPVQLQQVVLNLIANGMDAMSETPLEKTITCRTEHRNGRALLSISDTGPGISGEKLKDIFEPFFTTKAQGMGIGLSIARTIVQAHKGQIWAEDQPEGGAVFCVSLPLSAPVLEGGDHGVSDL